MSRACDRLIQSPTGLVSIQITVPEAVPSLAQHLFSELLMQQTKIWLPTPLGWLMLLGSGALIGRWLLRRLYPFLAVNAPIAADVLVVDGWMPDYALEQVYTAFQVGSYRQIITVGTAISRGHYLSEYKTYADVAAATLIALGIPATQIATVAVPVAARYRTHNSAAVLKQWLDAEQPTLNAVNLCTLGAHARRSWLLYRRNLVSQVQVGVISLEPMEYDSNCWWRCSAGGRVVIAELIGYLYTRLTLPWMTTDSDPTES